MEVSLPVNWFPRAPCKERWKMARIYSIWTSWNPCS